MNNIEKLQEEILTEQQQIAFDRYKKEVEDEFQELPFWEWYSNFCTENGYFNDKASYQK